MVFVKYFYLRDYYGGTLFVPKVNYGEEVVVQARNGTGVFAIVRSFKFAFASARERAKKKPTKAESSPRRLRGGAASTSSAASAPLPGVRTPRAVPPLFLATGRAKPPIAPGAPPRRFRRRARGPSPSWPPRRRPRRSDSLRPRAAPGPAAPSRWEALRDHGHAVERGVRRRRAARAAAAAASPLEARRDRRRRARRARSSPSAAPAACALVAVLLALVSSASPSPSRLTCRLAATSCSRPPMAPPSDADSTMARVSHEFDLPGDDGESQSLRRRRCRGTAAPRH